ncbi:tripartite tricarboxylate transporter permease [Bacillus sp. Marseille-P3661]|uniref:tripartite tricarboxylate transporter permease n=1 Tax=Bacillus sp. Marseille-P3661 TaxID=1936234 RepID=UPI000C81FB96|nr:tripartite tricarboxylate transporter permease [Bacillus sp. Marseille-P3661]
MVDWPALFDGINMVSTWSILFLSILGVILGIVLGMIPGLSATIGIALMLPMSYHMDALSVMVLMLGIYTGGLYGGSITATLINTPGTPGSAFTALEGYPMNQQGKGLLALNVGLISSVLGGIIGIIMLFLFLELLSKVAYSLGSAELFMIAFFALAIIATISKESIGKTFFIGSVGIVLANIGVSPTGFTVGTYGQVYLLEGIPLIPALIALFAFPEVFSLIEKNYITSNTDIKQLLRKSFFKEFIAAFKIVIKHPFTVIRSALIGVFVGMIPAAGASVASLISYGEAKRASKEPELFGKGAKEGLIASESANNASEGGSLGTAICLGIPGSAATAMMLAALTLQGIMAGPKMIRDHKDFIYGIIAVEFVQMFLLLLIGLVIIFVSFRLVLIPAKIIAPCLVILCLIGAYANRFTLFDVWLVILLGIIGYFLKKFDYPIIALVLGLLLGDMLNTELIRVAQINAMDFTVFFKRPISLILFILTLLTVARSFYIDFKKGSLKS